MKKRITALLLCLVMALSLVPTTVWATDLETEGTDEGISVQAITGNWDKTCSSTHGTAYLSTTQKPDNFTYLRNNTVQDVTKQVGETGSYQRLPRYTAICRSCNNTLVEVVPDYYATGAGVTLSDPTALKDYSFTLELSDFAGYTDYPCLKFNYTVAKATECKVTLTFYYNYDYPGESGYCDVCWNPVTVAAKQSWYQETTTFTINPVVTPTPQQDITLTYDANGGVNPPAPDKQKAGTDGYADFTISSTVPTRNYSKFLGWANSASATEAQYFADDSLKLNADKTIFAVWEHQHEDKNNDGFCDDPACKECLHKKDNKGDCTVKECQHIKDGKDCCQKEAPKPDPVVPAAPTRDDIFNALNGLVTVTCINRVWKDGNKVMDCGEGQYAAKAGIVGQNYTIKQDENNANAWIVTFPVTNFVKAFKQTPAHDLYSNNTLNWSITRTDEKWTAAPVEPDVDDLVKLTHAPTDWREVNKVTHNGIWTSCENGKTGKCEYGIAAAFVNGANVVSVEPEAGVPGSYIATFKVSTYADTCAKACNNKNFQNSSRTHDLQTPETVRWRLYATDQADEKIGNQVLNHVWAATPVTKGEDDICNVAHRVKVTFNENYNNVSTTDVMYKYNTAEVKEGIFPADPVREGYTFKGWNTKANGTGTAFGAKTIVTDDVTVYAQWKANTDTPYKVEHYQEKLDGTYELKETENLPGTTDTTATAVPKSYTGFTVDKTVEGTVASGNIAGNGSLVLKLYYTRNSYTVTFQPDNGDAATTATVKYDDNVAEPATDPTKTGYTFVGWFADGANTAFDFDKTTITGNITLTAHWTINQYDVVFDSDGGSSVPAQKVNYNEKAQKPADPTKSGYTFGGWYTDNKCTKGNEFSFDTKITGNMTLYAKWDVKRTGTNPDAKNPYIKDNTKKDDGKTVKSGDTFDAGISLYVGLGILSLTGSAAAIYKRREEY